MPAITLTDLNNGKQDLDHIAELATSAAPTAMDRLGNVKPTVRGALASLKAFNLRGQFAAGANYAVKDVYLSGNVAYVALVDHVATTVAADLAAGKVSVHQGATREELTAPDGAGTVMFSQAGAGAVPRSVLSKLREISISITDYPSLRAAIDALPAQGGVIDIPVGRFPAGVWTYDTNYMAKDNVMLRGAKMPSFSADGKKLEGGSIIEGKFNVFANNFGHENLGYDSGQDVVDRLFGGLDTHAANHPNGGTWDAFAFGQPSQGNPLPPRRGFYARNVVALLKDPGSYGHAMLMEGFDGGVIDNVVGMCGIHALVIKAKNVTVGSIAGYSASTDHVILKSDSYANGNNIKIDTVECNKAPPGVTPWFVPVQATYGLFLNPATASMDTVKISKARLFGATTLLRATGPAGNNLDNLMIGQLEIEGYGLANPVAVNFDGLNFYRCKLGQVTINNVADGIAYTQTAAAGSYGADPFVIDSVSFGGTISMRALQAIGYGRFVIHHMRAAGTIATLYSISDTARVHVGREEISGNGVTTKFGGANAPALTAGWKQFAGNQAFNVKLENYGVVFQGLLQPVNGGTPAVVSLPVYLRSSAPTRMTAAGRNAGGQYAPVLISSAPDVTSLLLNEGQNVTGAETWLSLQGVRYGFD
jgi:hypothetical protein